MRFPQVPYRYAEIRPSLLQRVPDGTEVYIVGRIIFVGYIHRTVTERGYSCALFVSFLTFPDLHSIVGSRSLARM